MILYFILLFISCLILWKVLKPKAKAPNENGWGASGTSEHAVVRYRYEAEPKSKREEKVQAIVDRFRDELLKENLHGLVAVYYNTNKFKWYRTGRIGRSIDLVDVLKETFVGELLKRNLAGE